MVHKLLSRSGAVSGRRGRTTTARRDKDRLKDKLVQRLRKLGYAVEVSAAEPAA